MRTACSSCIPDAGPAMITSCDTAPPLFLAQVDPVRLTVLRDTERVLVPERGAELGNFSAAAINARESWVTVSEGLWNKGARSRGAKGALFAARVYWGEPKAPLLKSQRDALKEGKPVRVVCFGDSVTGVYYHTGSRRAYTDMLGSSAAANESQCRRHHDQRGDQRAHHPRGPCPHRPRRAPAQANSGYRHVRPE